MNTKITIVIAVVSIIFFLNAFNVFNVLKEGYANFLRSTRNMSYDIRGDPFPPTLFNPYVSPWNISTMQPSIYGQRQLIRSRSPLANTSYLTPYEFKTYSTGLVIPPTKTIQKGYLQGWPEIEENPISWINPALLNTEDRWAFYTK